MDTPITLSSSSSKGESPRMSQSSGTSCTSPRTLANVQKVTDWMNGFKTGPFSSEEFIESNLDRLNEVRDSLVIVRCDFKKETKSGEFRYEKNSYSKGSDSVAMENKVECEKVNNKSENGSIYEVPLSPDSHKKELYNYLQLMNPLDKKEIFILQNRRSSRVRNLEKKEQEKKSRELEDKAFEIKNNTIMLKSLKDLNIQLEPTSEKVKEKKTFVFPSFKMDEMMVRNFDDMENIILKYRKDIGRKVKPKIEKISKRNRLNKIKNKENFKKLKTRLKIKETSKKPFRSLRSTSKISLRKLKKQRNNFKIKINDARSLKLKKFRKKMRTKKLERNSPKISQTTPPKIHLDKNEALNLINTTPDKENNSEKCENFDNFEHFGLHDLISSDDYINLTEEHKKSLAEVRKIVSDDFRVVKNDVSSSELLNLQTESDDLVDLQNFVDDMADFQNLSEEHKRCLIETRLWTSSAKSLASLSPFRGYSSSEINKCKKLYENSIFDDKFNFNKTDEAKTTKNTNVNRHIEFPDINTFETESTNSNEPTTNGVLYQEKESGYSDSDRSKTPLKRDSKDSDENTIVPFNKNISEIKSLHRSLCSKRKSLNSNCDLSPKHLFSPDKQKKSQHSIYLEREDGPVIKAFYIEYNLIICQEGLVSFYTQTALGNVLGAQNMWIPKGSTRRLTLSNKCIRKESMEMVVSTENNIVYIELWTKEHKSDIRANPVADVFVTMYFWKQRQVGLEKKVLQLENISGFADDVQYCVIKYLPTIVVCWHSASNEIEDRKTYIHSYRLADDFQTVGNICELEPVGHYVSSLHNIEDCENLIMGCGENKVTLWNLEYGYIVATIEMNDIKSALSTLWVKCDRGFLFTLQQCVDKELRLIAINGINHSWKKLAGYVPPNNFDRLRGVCVEDGMIVSFYDRGIICWNAQTGEPIVEETQSEIEYIPCQKYVVMLVNDQVVVKHAVAHLISPEDV